MGGWEVYQMLHCSTVSNSDEFGIDYMQIGRISVAHWSPCRKLVNTYRSRSWVALIFLSVLYISWSTVLLPLVEPPSCQLELGTTAFSSGPFGLSSIASSAQKLRFYYQKGTMKFACLLQSF